MFKLTIGSGNSHAWIVCAASLLSLGVACSSDRPRVEPPPPEVTLQSIAITPAGTSVVKGEMITFSAAGSYSDGTTKDLSADVVWSSGNTAIAIVLSSGTLTAIAEGNVEVRARFEEIMGTTMVSVTASPLSSIAVTPSTGRVEQGKTVTLAATGTYADGAMVEITGSLDWSSSDTAVVTMNGNIATGVATGTVTVTARDRVGGVQGTATVGVSERVPATVSVAPTGVSLALGLTQLFTATAHYDDGSSADFSQRASWSSSNTAVATVSNSPGSIGLVTALADGFSSITATHPTGVRASVTVRVTPPSLVRLTIMPSTSTVGVGVNIDFTASGTYTDGAVRDLTAAVDWTSSDPNIAGVSNTSPTRGRVATVNPGAVVISVNDSATGVSSDTTNTSARIRVLPPTLQSIAVVPLTMAVPLGLTHQFSAIGVYSDNSSQDLSATAIWTSSNQNVATVSATGLATSLAQGTTTISARDPVTGIGSPDSNRSAVLTVNPPALISLAVSPTARAMVTGSSFQFTATGSFSNGINQNLTNTVLWQSSGPAVSMSATGLASAGSVGTVTISAVHSATGISSIDTNQSAVVTVSEASLLSIAVTPASSSVPVGANVDFIATGTYDNGATANITPLVDWSSSAANIASVSNAQGNRGRAIALASGATTIAALEPSSGISSAGSNQSGMLTVVGGINLTSLAVTPANATVDIGDTLPFSATGTFSNGATHPMSSSVVWASSNSQFATISNVEGSRGVATGIAVGATSITAAYAAAGITSPAVSLTVELGIVTLSGTWPGPTVSIDGTVDYGVTVGQVVFSANDFPPGSVITDVNFSINFLKTDGSCTAPLTGNAYHNETSFRLQAPTGAQVILAAPGTWNGANAISPVTVVFDQSAAAVPSGVPVSGTFRPTPGSLDTLNGLNPVGTWVLQAGDNAGGDPLCVISYTITVTAQ